MKNIAGCLLKLGVCQYSKVKGLNFMRKDFQNEDAQNRLHKCEAYLY